MALSLAELRTEIRGGIGQRDADLDDARLLRVLNMVQDSVVKKHSFRELEASTTITALNTGNDTSDSKISLAGITDLKRIRTASLTSSSNSVNNYLLRRVNTKEWDRLYTNTGRFTRSRPTHYSIWEDMMEIYPLSTNSKVITIRYIKKLTVLANDTDVLTIKDKDELIIELVLHYLLSNFGSVDLAQHHWVISQRLMREAIEDDMRELDVDYKRSANVTNGKYWSDPFFRG